jgi:hypothetical protein
VPTESRPRLLALIGLCVLGVLLGFVGAGVMALDSRVGAVLVPWGVVLAIVGVAVTVRGAAWFVGSRRGAAAVLVGWLLPTVAFSAINPGGDVVLTDERRTYVYLLATFALGLLAATWPLPAGAAALLDRAPVSDEAAVLAYDDAWVYGDAPVPPARPEAPQADPDPPSRPD